MSSVRSIMEEAIKSTVSEIANAWSLQLCTQLKDDHGVEVQPKDILEYLEIVLARPPSTPGGMNGSSVQTVLPNMPPYLSGNVTPSPSTGAKKKGGRVKKVVDPNLPKCEYKITRGDSKGKGCEEPIANDGTVGADRFCTKCLKKSAVKKQLEGTAATKSTVQPPSMPGSAVKVENQQKEEAGDLSAVALNDGRPNYFREANHGFIVEQTEDNGIVVHAIDDGKSGERPLTKNEKVLAENMGLRVLNDNPINIPSLPKVSIPTVPTVSGIQVPKV